MRLFEAITEPIERDLSGVYHPIHLQVLFNQYEVIRNSGYGQFTTTWLVMDLRFGNHNVLHTFRYNETGVRRLQQFVALKILKPKRAIDCKELGVLLDILQQT